MGRPVAFSLERWPIAALAQAVRHELDDVKIAGLVTSLRAGKHLPPIFVLVDGGVATILDGHHRVAAWITAGYPDAPVIAGRPQ